MRRLPEGRGSLIKDATIAEFVKMIDGLASDPTTQRVLGTLDAIVLVLLVLAGSCWSSISAGLSCIH